MMFKQLSLAKQVQDWLEWLANMEPAFFTLPLMLGLRITHLQQVVVLLHNWLKN
jgi:hypothetical protein